MLRIAVIGATGAVGRQILSELEEQDHLANAQILAFASPRSAGTVISYRNKPLKVQAFALNELKGCHFALMSAGGEFSRQHAKAIADLGVIVIDNSSAWRSDLNVPLVVSEVNPEILKHFTQGIIANPNCSTMQMVVSLRPLAVHFGLEQVFVSTYQSVSGTGQRGITELSSQIKAHMSLQEPKLAAYQQPIAFNVLASVGPIGSFDYCQEEEKMIQETRRILSLNHLEIFPTTVRVPVFHCHSEAITVRLSRPVNLQEAKEVMGNAPGQELIDTKDASLIPSPHLCSGQAFVSVARLRLAFGKERSPWLQFWNVADNLRKGAATNAVQIMNLLIQQKGALR